MNIEEERDNCVQLRNILCSFYFSVNFNDNASSETSYIQLKSTETKTKSKHPINEITNYL